MEIISNHWHFIFCGIYDNFHFYPPGNPKTVSVKYFEEYTLEINIIFDLTREGITFLSAQRETWGLVEVTKMFLRIVPNSCSIQTFHLLSDKYQYFRFHPHCAGFCVLFDGPGFHSKRLFARNNTKMESSAFVAILKVICQTFCDNQSHLNFSVMNRKVHHIFVNDDHVHWIGFANNSKPFSTRFECIQLEVTKPQKHFNITMTKFMFLGHKNTRMSVWWNFIFSVETQIN